MKTRKLSGWELFKLPEGTKVVVVKEYEFFEVGMVITRVHNMMDDENSCYFSGMGMTDFMTFEEVELLIGGDQ